MSDIGYINTVELPFTYLLFTCNYIVTNSFLLPLIPKVHSLSYLQVKISSIKKMNYRYRQIYDSRQETHTLIVEK